MPTSEPLDHMIAESAEALGIRVDPAWLPEVRGHLQVTLRLGALVTSFPLPDESEPAPVFKA
jgi:hypothetical protein